ncbi:MAG: hypothetical protein JXR14_12780 [Paracoccaceae bacterium]
MRSFRKEERGFVLLFSIIVLPVFFAFALIIFDIGRGNNAHAELQAAADSLALAGAAELDGEPGAIAAANAAMEELSNSVALLTRDQAGPEELLYTTGSTTDAFNVVFLSNIPALDTTPIDSAWLTANATSDDADAEFVYVSAQSDDLQPLFAVVLGLTDNVPIGAVAVATRNPDVACKVVPIMICNPFEAEGLDTLTAMNQGRYHGRMFHLIKQLGGGSADPTAPGNWGYLRTYGTGANVLREAMAGGANECFSGDTVDTEPGAVTSVRQGFNTRYGIYTGPFNGTQSEYPQDENINNFSHQSSGDEAWYNVVMDPLAIPGSTLGTDSNWNLRGECQDGSGEPIIADGSSYETMSYAGLSDGNSCSYTVAGSTVSGTFVEGYWEAKHGVRWDDSLSPTVRRTYPNEGDPTTPILTSDSLPSRFDIHQYELNAEPPFVTPPSGSEEGRRELFTAIVNCDTYSWTGAGTDIPVEAYATVFTTSPMEGTQDGLDFELTDIVGFAGSEALNEKFIREAILKR